MIATADQKRRIVLPKPVDLVDRALAAISAESGITLIHTDKVLRDLEGFLQKWFKNTAS